MTKIEESVAAAILPALEELDIELVEVKHRFGAENSLTVFIDQPSGISLDDCERVSNALEPILDRLDLIESAYALNISSAGLDRPIVTERDYKRNCGREVEAKLFAPLAGTKIKRIEGVLEGRTGDEVMIRQFDGALITLLVGQIAKLTQLIKFD